MSDPTAPDTDTDLDTDPAAPVPGPAGADLEISLSAFLPDDVVLGDPDPAGPGAGDPDDRTGTPGVQGPDEQEPAVTDAADAPVEAPNAEAAADGDPTPAPAPVDTLPPAPAAEPEVDVALLDAVDRDLEAVDAALTALDDGTYGRCAVCSTPIDGESLAADPVLRTCPAHT